MLYDDWSRVSEYFRKRSVQIPTKTCWRLGHWGRLEAHPLLQDNCGLMKNQQPLHPCEAVANKNPGELGRAVHLYL